MNSLIVLILSVSTFGVILAVKTGGVSDDCKDITLPEHVTILNKLTKHVNTDNGSNVYRRLARVLCLQTQVVSGTNYHVRGFFAETTCTKTKDIMAKDVVTEEECPVKEDGAVEVCKAVFYEQSWTNTEELSSITCRDSNHEELKRPAGRVTRALVGAPSEVDVKHPDVVTISQQTELLLNRQLNSNKIKRVAQVVKATKQIVSGTKWIIEFDLVETECTKNQVDLNQVIDATKCPFTQNGLKDRCTVSVLDQPWHSYAQYQLLEQNCIRQ